MTGTRRKIARAAPLTAFLLLLLPAGAVAATPTDLLGQTVANVNGVVEEAGGTVGEVAAQVDGAVAATVEGARSELRDAAPAAPVGGTPAPVSEPRAAVDRTVAVAEKADDAATGDEPPASTAPVSPAQPPAKRSAARRQVGAPAASGAAERVLLEAGPPAGAVTLASDTGAGGSAPRPSHERPATSDGPAGPSPAGPAAGAGSGAGVPSSPFSAGAFAVLLTALWLAASALRTRLPRFGEVARPLPLVFALERPG